MATPSSVLAWKIPWTEEPGGLQSTGLQRVEYYWVTEHTQIRICINDSLYCTPETNTTLSISYTPIVAYQAQMLTHGQKEDNRNSWPCLLGTDS